MGDWCPVCTHSWHGLTCEHPANGHDEYPRCGCPSPFMNVAEAWIETYSVKRGGLSGGSCRE